MPGTEELMARLQRLEDGYYGDREAARQQSFFDTYGSRFSNNRGLGLAILNELDARGIDTSAADEAVQQILDQLQMKLYNRSLTSLELNVKRFLTLQNRQTKLLFRMHRRLKKLLTSFLKLLQVTLKLHQLTLEQCLMHRVQNFHLEWKL